MTLVASPPFPLRDARSGSGSPPAMRTLLAAVMGYAIGCLNAAYYVVRLRGGPDVRATGSGNAGARNVLRTRGRAEALAVVLLDIGRGALAVVVATWLAPGSIAGAAQGVAAAAVVAGHIWPIQLRVRGGRGAAPLGGAVLALSPAATGVGVAAIALVWLLTRSSTRAGLTGIAVVPAAAAALGLPGGALAGVAAACALVLVAHHPRFRPTPTASEAERP